MAANIKIGAQAYHEAGHAFVGRMMKIRITEVYWDGTEGYTVPAWTSGDINFEKLCFFLAGELTEYRFSENFSERHSGDDRQKTDCILFLLSGDYAKQHAIWLKAIQTVNELLDKSENARKIKKIAEELTAKISLSEDDIKVLMEN